MVKTNRSTLHMLYNKQQFATQDSDYIHGAFKAQVLISARITDVLLLSSTYTCVSDITSCLIRTVRTSYMSTT